MYIIKTYALKRPVNLYINVNKIFSIRRSVIKLFSSLFLLIY
jgi:hypothetical protein